jgi:hydroxymethylpyrimidine/phosphomethylpyrimidine kinase
MLARALSVAGSDSSGGAGIQADLKTFTVLRVYGMTAITAITVQNSSGVKEIHPLPPSFVERQIRMTVSDIGVDAMKTGMLYSTETVVAVSRTIRDYRVERVVVDPVLIAQSGDSLAADDLTHALLSELVPQALLVTPNLDEAQTLTGIRIQSIEDMRKAARLIIRAGAKACLVKGGHLPISEAVDVFDDGRSVRELSAPRLPTQNTHGTGCQLSAAITAFVARGLPLESAIHNGKEFITRAIRCGLALGHGAGPANPLAWLDADQLPLVTR